MLKLTASLSNLQQIRDAFDDLNLRLDLDLNGLYQGEDATSRSKFVKAEIIPSLNDLK